MLGFIVALVAGFLTPHLETPIARPFARLLEKRITLAPSEMRLIAFMIALLGAGLISSVLDSGSAFWITLGVCIGYFATRGVAAVRDFAKGKDLED